MSRFDREATLDDVRDDARELLQGAIDVHVHASPDPYAQRYHFWMHYVQAHRQQGAA